MRTFAARISTVLTTLLSMVVALSLTGSVAADAYNGEPVVVTMWWVIFNYPENCSDDSCGANDLVDAPDLEDHQKVKASVVYGTGQVTDDEGKVTLVSSLYSTNTDFGDSGATAFSTERLLKPFGKGLLNPAGANVHLVMRSHGAVIDEHLDAQLTTVVDPGCKARGGPNDCRYIYGAVHPQGQATADVIVFGKRDEVVEGASSILFRENNGLKAIVRIPVDLEIEDDS